MDRTLYPGVENNWDDAAFREVILGHLDGGSKDVLDLGAGAGIVPHMNFREKAKKMCGVDPDPRVVDNPFLDEGIVGFGEAIPYPDDSFDVVFADNVFEHLERPAEVFAEARRVLRKGGVFLAKTPNRFHYVPLIASITPHPFHEWVNARRGREESDTFPTHYRANTPRAVRALARSEGFSRVECTLIESRPEYLRRNPVTYFAGWAYERTVNGLPFMRPFRVVMICEAYT